MEKSKIRSYFDGTDRPKSGGFIFLLILGFVLLLIPNSGARVFGGLCFIGGIAGLIYNSSQKGISDEEIDQVCKDKIKNITDKALKKIGLDKDQVSLIEPIIVDGPYYHSILKNPLVKEGLDGVYRSSNYKTSVMFFSEEQVFYYSYVFSIISDEKKTGTDEYFYKDIVSISTSDETTVIKNTNSKQETTKLTVSFQEFKLTTSGGTSIRNSILSLDDYTEKSIQGMKQLLRQKKRA